MNLWRYAIRRVLNGVVAYCIIMSVVVFIAYVHHDIQAMSSVQWNAKLIMGERAPQFIGWSMEQIQEYKDNLMKELKKPHGLDRPILQRVIERTINVTTLNLGTSHRNSIILIVNGTPKRITDIKNIILNALPNTLVLFVSSTILSMFISIYLGFKKAQYHNSLFDQITTGVSMFFYGIPSWLFANIMVLVFVVQLDWLPYGYARSVPATASFLTVFLDKASLMVLPLLSIILVRFWGNAILIKGVIIDTYQQDYIAAARGRGLPEKNVMFGHVLRSVSPAIATITSATIVNSFAGDLLVEKVLAWPGIGFLLWESIIRYDVRLLTGILSVLTIMQISLMVILDIAYVFLDPRIKYS